MKKQAIFLLGPTASGKTDLAMKLYQKYPIDIISVDSAMIYKGMDIGTGKPTKEELKLAPHKLIDILDPPTKYSVSQFYTDAVNLMNNSIENNRIPLLVGGTMMYFNILFSGISNLPEANQNLRAELDNDIKKFGLEYLYKKLEQLDPAAAKNIKPTDPQRIQRALEVCILTGNKFSQLQLKNNNLLTDWDIKKFAIAPIDRKILHNRIEKRFHQMLDLGFIEEAKKLPYMNIVGYKQIHQYLNNEIDKETMIYKSIVATRQLAKRQFTWARKWDDLTWLDSENYNLDIFNLS